VAHLTPAEAYAQFKKWGRNSSHFVWSLDHELRYFQASNEWVFAYSKIGKVTLIALEPLIPGAPIEYSPTHHAAFELAWKEFREEIRPEISAFVAVYTPFLALLKKQGFQTVQVGHEPWIKLADCIPKGNSGKGVRTARNRALKSGLFVEEWASSELVGEKHEILRQLTERWKSRRLIQLEGFMNASDPFAHAEDRRYFVIRSSSVVYGYLIAAPIPGIRSFFLEDLVLSPHAPRGAGELITLDAMVGLQQSGIAQASLGVISVNSAGAMSHKLPRAVERVVIEVPALLRKIYNFQGLELFRKRFKPHFWENTHLAVKNESRLSDTRAWFATLWAILKAFRPRIGFSRGWLLETFQRPFRRYPITLFVGAISVVLYGAVNHWGELPEDVLERFGFTASTPIPEWLYRSVTSDFLYFNLLHILSCLIPLLIFLGWAERTHSRKFMLIFIPLLCVFDDLINFVLIIKPFKYFHPITYAHLLMEKDVGGSLWLMTLLGLQLCQLRRNREIIFACIALAVVFGLAFHSEQYRTLVLNLNHFLFLTLGFIVGKTVFEYRRRQSRLMSKQKPPLARTVRAPA
jgi:membrane associated rhomboid family serine protease